MLRSCYEEIRQTGWQTVLCDQIGESSVSALTPYVYLPGKGRVILAVPHSLVHRRGDMQKRAEEESALLALTLHRICGVGIFVRSNGEEDPNFDRQSSYRDALADIMRQSNCRMLLDLHEMHAARPATLCIGTGHGQNLCGRGELPALLQASALDCGISPVTFDTPFAADLPETVSADLSRRTGIPCIQLEFSTRLLYPAYPDYAPERAILFLKKAVEMSL